VRKTEVEIGKVYACRISRRIVPIRIEAVAERGGWYARNLRTGRSVYVRNAGKLRARLEDGGEAAA
jgi:hypothetical protein